MSLELQYFQRLTSEASSGKEERQITGRKGNSRISEQNKSREDGTRHADGLTACGSKSGRLSSGGAHGTDEASSQKSST